MSTPLGTFFVLMVTYFYLEGKVEGGARGEGRGEGREGLNMMNCSPCTIGIPPPSEKQEYLLIEANDT